MTFITPHINTIIIDIGSENTRVGYTTDFLPYLVENTAELCKGMNHPVKNSLIADPASYVHVIKKILETQQSDNVIIILHPLESKTSKLNVLRLISENKICKGVLFISSAVCEIFGNGKTSGVVLNCSAGSFTSSVLVSGYVKECSRIEKGGIYQTELISKYFKKDDQGNADIQEMASENPDIRDCLERLNNSTTSSGINYVRESALYLLKEFVLSDPARYKIFDEMISEFIKLIDESIEHRKKFNLKKNTPSGYIIMTGGVFRNREFLRYFKNYIISKYSDSVNESIISDDKYESCFAGAVIFGSNNLSQELFITPSDYFKYKEKIFAIKELKCN